MPSPSDYRKELLDVEVGYGLMSLTWRKDPLPAEKVFPTMKKVVEKAGNKKALFNVGEFYGPHLANYKLLQSFFDKYPEDRKKVIISAKGGVNVETLQPTGDADSISASIENALKVFGGYLDIYEPARIDLALAEKNGEKLFPRETFDTIVKYIKDGKVGGFSLSEVTNEQIRAIYKEYGEYLACVEVELSIASPEIISNGILVTCNEFGIPVVAYAPLGRGLLTGSLKSTADIPEGDFRGQLKRFQDDAIAHNLTLVKFLQDEIAAKRSDNPSLPQVAIGWVRGLRREYPKTNIIPIPSGSSVEKVSVNFDHIDLSDDEMSKIKDFLKSFKIAGDRYEFAQAH